MNRLALTALALTLMTACGGGSRVRYGDARAVETVNENYGSTDLQMVADRMVRDLVTSPLAEERPYIAIRAVKNNTGEYIDTKALTNKIRTALLRSAKFRFTTEHKKEVLEEVEMQESSGLYRKEGAAKVGNWVPPKYLLKGYISEIRKQNEDVKDVYMLFQLNLIEVDSATVVWAQEKEIRKVVDR